MIDVNKAKQKILDLAIRGKLTKQLKSDGDAADLLVEIQKEKEKLIKDKKIRNDTNVISDDIEEPFEIPENWVWCKIGEIGIYKKGPFGSSLKKSLFVEKSKDTIKVYEQQNAINHNSELGKYYISKEYFESKMKGFEVFSGDLIVSCAGTIGEIYLMPERIERGIINQALMKISLFNGIDKQYFIKYFDYSLKQSASEGNGSAIINIPPFEVLKNYVMPLPPLAEQIRIVEKVDKLFEILDKIDEAQKKYQKDKETLKSKIIEAGIRGKLTKQLKSDGNASDLLDEIKKVKEKKTGKKVDIKAIDESDQPFEIPKNWVWAKMGMIFDIGSSKRVHKSDWRSKGVPFYRARDIGLLNKGIFKSELYISEQFYKEIKSKYSIPKINDILVTAVGTLGKTFVVDNDLPFYYKDGNIICLSNCYNINPYYIKIIFESSFIQETLNTSSYGTTVNTYTIIHANNTIIPLPPLKEQERIVKRIEELLEKIDNK